MEVLTGNIGQVIGLTVLHSLWQGLLVYLLLQVVLAALPRAGSVHKYWLSFGALLVMATWFIITLVTEAGRLRWIIPATAPLAGNINYLPPHLNMQVSTAQAYQQVITQYLPYVATIYLFGLLFNVMRLGFAWRSVVQVRRNVQPALPQYEQIMQAMAKRLGLARAVAINISHMVDVPGIVGYLKPVVLLPVSMASNLTLAEAEAIILHELVHIKHNHYLHNVLQQTMQVVLFFNPFSLLINRTINAERENCCDDEVVALTGEPLTYARALLKLEQQKQNNLQLALAATGKKFALLNRIERIMTTKSITINIRHTLAAIVLFALSLGSIAWFNPNVKNKINKAVKASSVKALLADTVPSTKKLPPPPNPPKALKSKKLSAPPVPPPPPKRHAKTYTMHFDEGFEMNDPELERLSKEVEKHGEAINKFYESGEFKALSDKLSEKAAKVDEYYNRPELKKLLDRQAKVAADFDKNFANNPQMRALDTKMQELGNAMDKYYNSPDFKNLTSQIDAQALKLDKLDTASNEFKAERKKLQELSRKLSAMSKNPQMKEQQEQMRALSKKMRDYYQAEGYKKRQAELRTLSDSLRVAFANDKMRLHNDEMRELSKKMRDIQSSSELKKEQEALKAATAKLRAYMQSEAYKANLKAAKEKFNKSFSAEADTVTTDR